MLKAIGLMSGTSMDGIDAAIINTDGRNIEITPHFVTVKYPPEFVSKIRQCIATKNNDSDVEKQLTELHAEAVERVIKVSGVAQSDIDVIGFHGQTIYHEPENSVTCQMGDGQLLANITGIDVVNDFRSADMKAGGQGAPLVPIFHDALMRNIEKPVAILNIGGVANVTYLGQNGEIIAFDTGPGNALINDWVERHTGMLFDKDGEIAAKGNVDYVVLKRLLGDEYFRAMPPKSLDRNHFSAACLESLSLEDGAATLAAFTAKSIAMASDFFPDEVSQWLVAGGGRHNKTLVKKLTQHINDSIYPIEKLDYNGCAIEAQAFAYLAVRSIKNLPLTLPSTTGVKKFSVTGGAFYQPA